MTCWRWGKCGPICGWNEFLSDSRAQDWTLPFCCCLWWAVFQLSAFHPKLQVTWLFGRVLYNLTRQNSKFTLWLLVSRSTHIPAQRTPHLFWLLDLTPEYHDRGSILKTLHSVSSQCKTLEFLQPIVYYSIRMEDCYHPLKCAFKNISHWLYLYLKQHVWKMAKSLGSGVVP